MRTVSGDFNTKGGSRFGRNDEGLVINFGDGSSDWNCMGAMPLIVQVCVRGVSVEKGLILVSITQ